MHVVAILLALGTGAGVTLAAAALILIAANSHRRGKESKRWPLIARGDGRLIGGPAVVIGIIVGGMAVSHAVELFIALSVVAAILIGFIDDRYDLSPWRKLSGQAVAAALAAVGFARLAPAIPLVTGVASFMWIIVLFNAVNLIDGLDGLLIGAIAPGMAVLAIAGYLYDAPEIAALAAAACGALLAFLPFNHSRARLLLGDTGAEFVGFSMALITIGLFVHRPTIPAVPAMLLVAALPIADTAFAVIRRAASRRSIFTGDRGHIHHRLARRIGERKAVILLSSVSVIAAIVALSVLMIGR